MSWDRIAGPGGASWSLPSMPPPCKVAARASSMIASIFRHTPSTTMDVLTRHRCEAGRILVAEGPMSERHIRKAAGAVEWREVSAGKGARSQVLLGPDDGTPHFAM